MSSLDNLRKAAKRWLKALRAGDAAAVARLRRVYPSAAAEPALRDVQRALALERGFESWAALKRKVTEADPGALLDAASKGDAVRVAEILDLFSETVSRPGELVGHDGLRTALHFGIKHEAVVRVLLERGADPNVRDQGDNAMPLHEGVTGIADLLRQYGATPGATELDDEESFVAACLRLDSRRVHELVQLHPEYLTSPAAMFEAAKRNRTDVLQFLVDRGVSVEVRDAFNTRPLHHAASRNALQAARFLIERGAELDPRESQFGAPPIGWAAHGDRREMVDFLSQYSRNVRTISSGGYLDRLREILRDDPSLAQVTSANGVTPLWWLPDDEDQALEIVELLLAHGANPAARSKEGSMRPTGPPSEA